MEKRNIIEDGRTPELVKQAGADDFEKQAVQAFAAAPGVFTPAGNPVKPEPSLSVPWTAAAPQPEA